MDCGMREGGVHRTLTLGVGNFPSSGRQKKEQRVEPHFHITVLISGKYSLCLILKRAESVIL